MSNNNEKEKQLNELLSSISKKLGKSPDELKTAARNGNIKDIIGKMDEKNANKFQQALANKAVAQQILSSPKAQKILKNLLGDK